MHFLRRGAWQLLRYDWFVAVYATRGARAITNRASSWGSLGGYSIRCGFARSNKFYAIIFATSVSCSSIDCVPLLRTFACIRRRKACLYAATAEPESRSGAARSMNFKQRAVYGRSSRGLARGRLRYRRLDFDSELRQRPRYSFQEYFKTRLVFLRSRNNVTNFATFLGSFSTYCFRGIYSFCRLVKVHWRFYLLQTRILYIRELILILILISGKYTHLLGVENRIWNKNLLFTL